MLDFMKLQCQIESDITCKRQLHEYEELTDYEDLMEWIIYFQFGVHLMVGNGQ